MGLCMTKENIDFKEMEDKWQKFWESEGIYRADLKKKKIYSIDIYKKGEVYKKDFPTIWCPECQTSIAQAELEDKESNSLFSTLKFKVGEGDLLIATTRPELLGACVAVFVNPKDKRYKKFVGKKAKVPLFNQEVPILEDESAEM